MAAFRDRDGMVIDGVEHGSWEAVREDGWHAVLVYYAMETAHPAAVYCVRDGLDDRKTICRVLSAHNVPVDSIIVVPLAAARRAC